MLDTYFKEFFWTFHLAVLAAAGFLVANAVNIFVEEALRLPPTALAAAADVASPERESNDNASTVSTRALLERNIFDAEREDLAPEPEPDPSEDPVKKLSPGDIDMDDCEKSSLRAKLVATVVTSSDDHSVAVFVDTSKNRPTAFHIGEKLLGQAEILAIEWRRVAVDNGGRCEFFSLDDDKKKKKGSSRPVASLAPPPKRGAPKMQLGKGVKKLNEGEYEIPRDEIDNVLGNLNVVATQARIVPSFRNGKANGFKLFSIRPGSLYSKIGIQNGDIIQKINGYEINSPDKALQIYSKLKDAQQITVDLVRRGRAKTMSYAIR